MPIPDYQSLMLPVLVSSSKGEVRIGSVVEELANQLGLSPGERSELLSKAQLVETTRRGHFRITARGQTVLQAQPTYIDNKFLMQFEQFRQFRERSIGGAEDGSGSGYNADLIALPVDGKFILLPPKDREDASE